MTSDLQHALDRYHQGLDAQIVILQELARVAAAQHRACLARDSQALSDACTDREQVMRLLLTLEGAQRPLRDELTQQRASLERLDGFETVHAAHRIAEELLEQIQRCDGQTLACIDRGEAARRATAMTLDAGGATLAAYRKTIAQVSPRSSLVDSRF